MSLFERLTSLFAPDECLSCRREGQLLCRPCSALLAKPPGVCFGCYAPIDGVACPACLAESGCGSLQAATEYGGFAKQLVARLKFMGNQSAARLMANAMLAAYQPERTTLVTHMPATTVHIRERGYDQAALLARHIARQTGCPRSSLLRRLGSWHQLGADRQQRLAQLKGSLRALHADVIAGRPILLIDDVLTTGASVRAAAATLLQAGAARVDVLVFAQALPVATKKD